MPSVDAFVMVNPALICHAENLMTQRNLSELSEFVQAAIELDAEFAKLEAINSGVRCRCVNYRKRHGTWRKI